LKTTLELIFEKHDDWVGIVCSFGCNRSTAEDIVQECYIKLDRLIKSGTEFMYNETEINHYYVFRTLRSLFIDLKRKEARAGFVDIEGVSEKKISAMIYENDLDVVKKYEEIQRELKEMHWYDQRVYNYIEGGESVASLSEKTEISYYSLYNTYKNVKKKLKKKL
jgi:DNA-directed RNA polymerase specialized sigma24 family protein